jgi:hypothetical protein
MSQLLWLGHVGPFMLEDVLFCGGIIVLNKIIAGKWEVRSDGK